MAAKFMLCGFQTCPWVQRAAIVLRAKQVEYDVTYVDRDHRPDWFKAVSPHGKVPVLVVGGKDGLFESNAIVEYLDETLPPKLHPEDAIVRARNRAWTDYLPTFAKSANASALAKSEQDFVAAVEKIAPAFGKIEDALAGRGNAGPYFNGERFSLLDAGYAPILQRHMFIERLHPIGIIAQFPRLSAWRDALLATPVVKASTVPEIETLWRRNLVLRKAWLAKFVPEDQIASVG
jgi:glutathione S-transferase